MSDENLIDNAYNQAIQAAKEGKFTKIESHLSKQPSRLFINAFLKHLLQEEGDALLSWYNKTYGLSSPVRNLATAILIGRNLGQKWFEQYAININDLRLGYIEHGNIKCTKSIFDKLAFQRITPKEIKWMKDKFYIEMDQWLEKVELDMPLNEQLLHPSHELLYDVYRANFNRVVLLMSKKGITNALISLFGYLDEQTIDCWIVGRLRNMRELIDPSWIDGDEYFKYSKNINFMKEMHFTKKGIEMMLQNNIDIDFILSKWIEISLRSDEIGSHILNKIHSRKRRNSL